MPATPEWLNASTGLRTANRLINERLGMTFTAEELLLLSQVEFEHGTLRSLGGSINAVADQVPDGNTEWLATTLSLLGDAQPEAQEPPREEPPREEEPPKIVLKAAPYFPNQAEATRRRGEAVSKYPVNGIVPDTTGYSGMVVYPDASCSEISPAVIRVIGSGTLTVRSIRKRMFRLGWHINATSDGAIRLALKRMKLEGYIRELTDGSRRLYKCRYRALKWLWSRGEPVEKPLKCPVRSQRLAEYSPFREGNITVQAVRGPPISGQPLYELALRLERRSSSDAQADIQSIGPAPYTVRRRGLEGEDVWQGVDELHTYLDAVIRLDALATIKCHGRSTHNPSQG